MWLISIAILWTLASFGLGCLLGRMIEFGQSTPADRDDDIF